MKIIKPILDEFPDVHFLFQSPRGKISIRGITPDEELRIQNIPEPLNKEQFFRTIAACSLVLVAYDPVAYRNRTSHIAIEALGAGRPIIATDGGAIVRELRRVDSSAAILANSFDAEGLHAALRQFLSASESYLSAAARNAHRWRQEHNIHDFLTRILQAPRAENT